MVCVCISGATITGTIGSTAHIKRMGSDKKFGPEFGRMLAG
jgi:hypothetical protein